MQRQPTDRDELAQLARIALGDRASHHLHILLFYSFINCLLGNYMGETLKQTRTLKFFCDQ